jgi:hypothetical protein
MNDSIRNNKTTIIMDSYKVREAKAKEIVEKIFNVFDDKGGFDGFWGHIDPDTQKEIEMEMNDEVFEILSK